MVKITDQIIADFILLCSEVSDDDLNKIAIVVVGEKIRRDAYKKMNGGT